LRVRDLEGEPLLLTEQGCSYRQTVESAFQRRGVRAEWALESGSTETLRAAARHGLGLAMLPRLAAAPPPPGTRLRRLDDLALALPVGLVTRPRPPAASPVLDALLFALRRELSVRPSRPF
jgi:DNA-binding transcriptional LysR family regulator